MQGIVTIARRQLDALRPITSFSRRAARRSTLLGAVLLVVSAVTVWATSNTPPQFTSLTAFTSVVNEGQTITLTGAFTDPDAADLHTLYIMWDHGEGRGTGDVEKVQLPAGQRFFQVGHTYRDDLAPTVIKVNLTDRQHPAGTNDNTDGIFGGNDVRRLPIQVNNVAPSFVSSSITVTKGLNRSVSVDGAFTDPGTLDTEQITANWSDPYATSPTTCSLVTDNRHFHCQHTYHQAIGVTTYRITLVARDDDGGTGAFQTSVTLP